MADAQKIDGQWVALAGGTTVRHGDVVASYETVRLWTLAEREAFGVYAVEDGDPPPMGQRVVSSTIVDRSGRPVWKSTLEPIPSEEPLSAASLVEAEKVRRIEAGFPFLGKVIQSRAEDRENIAGAKSAAQDAKLLGAQPGELGWQKRLDPEKGAEAFAWITLDNSMLPLDADAMIDMGYAAMLHKQRLIFVAKSIKDRIAAGEVIGDVTADALWG